MASICHEFLENSIQLLPYYGKIQFNFLSKFITFICNCRKMFMYFMEVNTNLEKVYLLRLGYVSLKNYLPGRSETSFDDTLSTRVINIKGVIARQALMQPIKLTKFCRRHYEISTFFQQLKLWYLHVTCQCRENMCNKSVIHGLNIIMKRNIESMVDVFKI